MRWVIATFLNFPSMKSLDIRQKLGSDEEMASDMLLTRSRAACHTGSPVDFAPGRLVSHVRDENLKKKPMTTSACFASRCNIAVRSCISNDKFKELDTLAVSEVRWAAEFKGGVDGFSESI